MQADKIIYEDSIVSFKAILMRQCVLTGDMSEYHEFVQVVNSVDVAETLKDNEFNTPSFSKTEKQAPRQNLLEVAPYTMGQFFQNHVD